MNFEADYQSNLLLRELKDTIKISWKNANITQNSYEGYNSHLLEKLVNCDSFPISKVLPIASISPVLNYTNNNSEDFEKPRYIGNNRMLKK